MQYVRKLRVYLLGLYSFLPVQIRFNRKNGLPTIIEMQTRRHGRSSRCSLTKIQKSKLNVCQCAMERSSLDVRLTNKVRNTTLCMQCDLCLCGTLSYRSRACLTRENEVQSHIHI